MDFIYQGLGYVIRFCYYTIGFESYALALFWFALIVKLLLLPFGIKQQKNQIKMAKLRPKMYAIEKKYAGRTDQVTLRKKQQEIMEMQQKEGYSPFAGCLPMLVQLPLILILYRIIQRPLSYICMLGEDAVKSLGAAVGLTGKEQEIQILSKILHDGGSYPELEGITLPNLNLFGVIDLSSKPEFWTWALFIPLFVFLSQFFTMKLTRWLNPAMTQAQGGQDAQMSLKIMDFAMPAMTLFFAFSLPTALGLYWIYQSLLSIVQMLLLAKFMPLPTFTEEELKAAERELRGKKKRTIGTGNAVAAEEDGAIEDRPRPRSLHYIDEDDDEIPAPAPKKPTPKKTASAKGIATAPLKKDKDDNSDN